MGNAKRRVILLEAELDALKLSVGELRAAQRAWAEHGHGVMANVDEIRAYTRAGNDVDRIFGRLMDDE